MNINDITEKNWYIYLKNKYQLTDNDMDEYIDSFDSINQGNPITISVLQEFVKNELNDAWAKADCGLVIRNINRKIHNKNNTIIDLKTFLFYIIPICQKYIMDRISIKEFFGLLDKDKDGRITVNELIEVLYIANKNYTTQEIKDYKEEIRKLYNRMDKNKDGFITFGEFIEFINSSGILTDVCFVPINNVK